ncbi:MAG: radical SAM protein [Ruminococcus sp.]|nr:radical SAM protein [Ruminococcus sp.]
MRVGLHDADMEHLNTKRRQKTFPNYALMKISAYHKALGDTVEWWLPNVVYDRVYSSKVFSFTPENPYLPADAIKGGTGYGLFSDLPPEIDDMFPDYSLYPNCDYAVGYLTRGCPNHCAWCVVPRKEGNIRPYRTWEQLVRPDTDKLVLMDNNILACQHGINQLESLIDSGYRIDLNQGMDARLVTDDTAKILSRLKWIKYIRFSCDTTAQIGHILKTADLLGKYGVKPYRMFIYLLVTEDTGNAEQRVEQLKQLRGITIYAQAERKLDGQSEPNALQKEFCQRYIYGGKFRSVTWTDYINERGLHNGKR